MADFQRGYGNHRDGAVAGQMPPDYPAQGHALGPGRAHIVLAQLVQYGGAGHAGEGGQREQTESDGRHKQRGSRV